MDLTLNTHTVQDVVVVDVSGRLTVGDPELVSTVRRLMDEGQRKFVLNLRDVSYVDSCGLGQLATTYTSVRNREGQVTILNPSERVRKLLDITKLATLFDTFDAEDQAIRVLSATPHTSSSGS